MLVFLFGLNKVHSFISRKVFVNDGDFALKFHDVKDSPHTALDNGLVLETVVFLLWG